MKPVINYDEMSDTLYVSFAPGENATGVELNDHLLLRINKQERRAVGLTFFDYSLLAQSAEFGPRSFPLTGLAALPRQLQQMVVEIISQPPVSDFLSLSSYTPSFYETVPITSVHHMPLVPA
jgi:uncharacterized protein YuzE